MYLDPSLGPAHLGTVASGPAPGFWVAAVTGLVDQIASLLPSGLDYSLLLIPPITGVIGYVTNWVGIRLLFYPVEFHGIDAPGLEQLIAMAPPKIQQIPGLMEGKLGWQGIIPSRAEKMGSIAATDGISMIATEREFYETFDPEAIADHVVTSARADLHRLANRILREEQPHLWRDAPPAVRRMVHARIDQRLPVVVGQLFRQMGDNVDELLDMQTLLIDRLGNDPELLNRMFLDIGDRELKFLVNSGLFIGTFLGCFSIPLFVIIDEWWVLPVAGAAVGYFTNFIAIKAIFNPKHPITIGPFVLQGLFIKRQDEASETYANIVASEIVTVENIADNMLNGRKGDRTRKLIEDSIREAVDRGVGVAGPFLRLFTGDRQYERIRNRVAVESVDIAFEPLSDDGFNEERGRPIRDLIVRRMRKLPPDDYCLMLRSAFKEDEWLLISVGGALGFVAGWIQLFVVTTV